LALRRRFLERLRGRGDRLVHRALSTSLLALDLELAQFALAPDTGFVEPAIGRDACALDFLAGGDLELPAAPATRAISSCSSARRAIRAASSACSRETSDGLDLLARRDLGLLDQRLSASIRSSFLAAIAITRSSSATSTAFF
jgi:hypothetical protein